MTPNEFASLGAVVGFCTKISGVVNKIIDNITNIILRMNFPFFFTDGIFTLLVYLTIINRANKGNNIRLLPP